MKILLFSDSHGNTINMVKTINKHKDASLIIHLGDMLKDIKSVEKEFSNLKFYYVKGNNDWNTDIPSARIVEVNGKKIFLTHGHEYGVKSDYQRIVNKGKLLLVDAVFFGHTHQLEEFFVEKRLFLNPGSIGGYTYTGISSYCTLEVTNDKIISKFGKVN